MFTFQGYLFRYPSFHIFPTLNSNLEESSPKNWLITDIHLEWNYSQTDSEDGENWKFE